MTDPLTRTLLVDGKEIETDAEGYIKNLDKWSEEFGKARAKEEALELTDQHWQVIRLLREYYQEHEVQAQVRVVIAHLRNEWGEARGHNHYMQDIFPIGVRRSRKTALPDYFEPEASIELTAN